MFVSTYKVTTFFSRNCYLYSTFLGVGNFSSFTSTSSFLAICHCYYNFGTKIKFFFENDERNLMFLLYTFAFYATQITNRIIGSYFLFQTLVYTYQALKCLFKSLEYTFQSLEQRIQRLLYIICQDVVKTQKF